MTTTTMDPRRKGLRLLESPGIVQSTPAAPAPTLQAGLTPLAPGAPKTGDSVPGGGSLFIPPGVDNGWFTGGGGGGQNGPVITNTPLDAGGPSPAGGPQLSPPVGSVPLSAPPPGAAPPAAPPPVAGTPTTPPPGASTAPAHTALDDALAALGNLPDRQALSDKLYNDYLSRTDEQYGKDVKTFGRNTAALGRIGAGGNQTALTDLTRKVDSDRSQYRNELDNQVASQILGDRLGVANTLLGADNQFWNQSYNQHRLEDDEQNTTFNQGLDAGRFGFGSDPSQMQAAIASQYGAEATDAFAGAATLAQVRARAQTLEQLLGTNWQDTWGRLTKDQKGQVLDAVNGVQA